VPAARPEIVVVAPVPGTFPGLIVQFPAGSPFRTTLPVAAVHATGCVIVPNVGVAGVPAGGSIVTVEEASEVHPDPIATVKL
jgi:hypothetical protein